MFFTKFRAIRHYDRMIKWAEKQNPDFGPDYDIMYEKIGENWYANSCTYCAKAHNDCILCKLNGSAASYHCCNGLWRKMSSCYTWKEWIEGAKEVREHIKKHG
jgi:hypothetical protein